MSSELKTKTKCDRCGADLVWHKGGAICPNGLDHGRIVPCSRQEFNAAVKAAKLAALPRADRLSTIGGWRLSDRPGVFWFSTLLATESENVPGSVRARVESTEQVRWFCPDAQRERDIESAGFRKETR